MTSMVDVILKVANGFAGGTARHNFVVGDEDDPYIYVEWKDGCFEYNSRLNSWRVLRKKATANNATDEIKKEYVKKTRELYTETFNRLSIGWIKFDGQDERLGKLEKDVKKIRADMRKLLVALNMEPSEEGEESSASGIPPEAKPPLPNTKEKGRFQQEPVA